MPSGIFYSVASWVRGSWFDISLSVCLSIVYCLLSVVCLFLGGSSATHPGDPPLATHQATHLATYPAIHPAQRPSSATHESIRRPQYSKLPVPRANLNLEFWGISMASPSVGKGRSSGRVAGRQTESQTRVICINIKIQ